MTQYTMIGKLKTIAWYIKQPKGLKLILNLIRQRTTYSSLEKTSDQSVAWCTSLACDTTSALKKIGMKEEQIVNLETSFTQEFLYARNKFESTPYQMGGAGNMNLLFNICEFIQAKYALETGVAYGWSSLSVLLSLSKRKDSLLVSTDMPYAKMGNEDFVGIVVPDHLRKHWNLIREADESGLPKAFQIVTSFDVVHYDSDKSYLGRMKSYPLLYDKLRAGGVFISDDIQDNIAFKHFCEQRNISPVVIDFDDKFVGLFIK